jgi:hypothetical protein
MFDLSIQIVGIDAVADDDHVTLLVQPALLLPVGPGQAMPLPIGVVRMPISKDQALAHAEAIKTAAENVDDSKQKAKSDLVIANSMQGVDEAARQAQQFRG